MIRNTLAKLGATKALDHMARAWFQAEFQGEHHLKIMDQQPVMLVMNHTAFFALEVYLLNSRLLSKNPDVDVRTLVWKGFTEGPASPWFRLMGCETVAIPRGQELLKQGKPVLIMPEGVGATDVRNRLNKFHTGYLRMLKEHPVPIIPIGFHGIDEAMPWIVTRNRLIEEKIMKLIDPSFDFVLLPKLPLARPSKVVFSIGEPIHLTASELDSEQGIQRSNTMIRNRICHLMRESERQRNRKIHGSRLNRLWHRAVEGKITHL